ncbi:hypothetical protein PFISCL1PPCAC_17643, partial [Pristionchus fissidentatus]
LAIWSFLVCFISFSSCEEWERMTRRQKFEQLSKLEHGQLDKLMQVSEENGEKDFQQRLEERKEALTRLAERTRGRHGGKKDEAFE